MLLSELKQAVVDLGFESALDADLESAFISASNRSIYEVNDIQPKMGVYSITHNPLDNLLCDSYRLFNVRRNLDCSTYESIDPKSYYFECDGSGYAYIENYVEGAWVIVSTITLSSTRVFAAYRGLITATGRVRLRFGTTYIFNIRNIAMYGYLLGALSSDIPSYTPFVRYDIKELTKDGDNNVVFMELDKVVIQEGEYSAGKEYKINQDYFVEKNCVVLLPYKEKGQFNIWYRQLPNKITIDTDDDDAIDLPDDLAILLPELVAHYVWMDDANMATKAVRYYELYKERAADVIARKRELEGSFIYKTEGWA